MADQPTADGQQEQVEEGVGLEAAVEEDVHISHFKNGRAHPVWLRYGIPLFLLATFVLLVNADVGSGISADYILIQDNEVVEEKALFAASIFSSVKELWHAGSYPLAILIVVTSIAWPYAKLLLAFYAWMAPYKVPRKREFMIEIIDAVGKWSFVDIIVLVEIMVAFRSSIKLAPDVTLEIIIIAKWGFYGFVLATMMSLVSTHVILYYHRKLHYHSEAETSTDDQAVENGLSNGDAEVPKRSREGESQTNSPGRSRVLVFTAVSVTLALYIAGCVVDIYEITNTRGQTSFVETYSIISVGKALPSAVFDPSDVGTRWIQAMWFFLCVAMPLWCSLLLGIVFLAPLQKTGREMVFFAAEIAFAWSCAEVLLVSTVFAVLQMPTFGDGLIDADCASCFIVDTRILPAFALSAVAVVLNVGVNIWLYRRAHHEIYPSKTICDTQGKKCSVAFCCNKK